METAAAAKEGADSYLKLLGLLSAYLGGFNLLPFPALDGGRLLFLGFEAASRRRADAKIEAKVHAIGLRLHKNAAGETGQRHDAGPGLTNPQAPDPPAAPGPRRPLLPLRRPRRLTPRRSPASPASIRRRSAT